MVSHFKTHSQCHVESESMENKRSRVDELKSILSSTKAKDEMRLLHIISLSKIMNYSELADTDKILEWVEVLVETISDPKLELFEQTYKGVFDESEQTAWRDNLDEDVNMVISLNKNIISNVGSDSLYRKKLKKVFSLVNRPGVILRAGLSHEQMELMSTLQTPMIVLRQMYIAEPRKYMDYLIEAHKDSNFSSILRMFDVASHFLGHSSDRSTEVYAKVTKKRAVDTVIALNRNL